MRSTRCPTPDRQVVPGLQPTFSVAIPVFQAAATIGGAIDSVLAQTLQPLEVVVCDDGSTDDLESALAPYLGRIKLLRQENGGEGSAKNAATRAASGDFVVILDADDVFLPERLEALAELAQARPDHDLLTTDAFLESNGTPRRRVYSGDWTFEVADQRQGILERNFVFGAAAIRRDRLLEVGGFDTSLRYAADWDLAIRLILSGSQAGLVDEPLYRYRVGPHALSARRAELVRGIVVVLERAAARPDLRAPERRVLAGTIEARKRELLLLELDESLQRGDGEVRSRAVAVLRDPNLPARAKGKALAACVAPGAVGRTYARRHAGAWIGAGGTFVGTGRTVRVAAYTDAELIGGAEISLGHVLAGLPPKYDVTIVGVDEAVVARLGLCRPGIRTEVLRPVRRKYDFGDILAHLRLLRRLRPAIVHVSLKSPWDCQYGILAAFFARARIVLVEQSLYPGTGRVRRSFARAAARHAAAVVAVGERSARRIEELLELERGSVRTIYNGVPDRLASPRPEGETRPVIGCVARLDHEKAHDTLIRALTFVDADALLVGDGPERFGLESLAAELGVGNRVTITGWDEDARRFLSSFTVFCLPSRSGTESFPLSVVEAMLAGLPVVATGVGSVREAVLDGETGFIVPVDDPEALAAAVRRLIDDSELRLQMGRRARRLALERFTADQMVAGFANLYEEILA